MLSKHQIQLILDRMANAYRAGDAVACANMFAQNAQLHSPFAPPAVGREAIRTLHEDRTSDGGTKSFALVDHGSTETMAWCLCRFSEGQVTGDGTSLIVLERDPTEGWLIRSCCLHGDPEPK